MNNEQLNYKFIYTLRCVANAPYNPKETGFLLSLWYKYRHFGKKPGFSP